MVKNTPSNAGDSRGTSSIPESGRSPGVGNGNLLQYSCLENAMVRGARQATVHVLPKGVCGSAARCLKARLMERKFALFSDADNWRGGVADVCPKASFPPPLATSQARGFIDRGGAGRTTCRNSTVSSDTDSHLQIGHRWFD